jgi:hypothetical protein
VIIVFWILVVGSFIFSYFGVDDYSFQFLFMALVALGFDKVIDAIKEADND